MFAVPSKVVFFSFHTHLAFFPSSFHPRYYSLSTLHVGCSSLFNVMTFLVFLSISSSLLFVHFTVPAPYLIKETAYVFIAMILFLPLRLLFMINFVLLRYSLRKFSFILLSLILLYSKIPRYLYPFFSTSLILSPSGISTPSDDTTFPLFNTSAPHFYSKFHPNIITLYLYLYLYFGNQSIYFMLNLCKDF